MSTPAQCALIARIAAHESWARTPDHAKRTQPVRSGFPARFERQVYPDGTLTPEERQRRAASAMRAHMQRLARRSAKARAG